MTAIKGKIGKFMRRLTMKSGINEIAVEERRPIQLKMLAEFDRICREYNLRYSLGYGTLLGAVRHKGFIPWDDDVDLIMPLPDLLKLKEVLQSDKLELHDVDTDMNYEFSFPRISNPDSFQRIGMVANGYGINIDLYVMIGISPEKTQREIYFKNANKLQKKRIYARRIHTYALYLLPLKTMPLFNRVIRRFRNYMYFSPITVPYDEASCYFCASGYRDERAVYDFDIFENLVYAPFENLSLRITDKYDRYLKKEYGDYMQLPPENERHPYHGGHYFWK